MHYVLIFMLLTDKGPDNQHIGVFADAASCNAAASFVEYMYKKATEQELVGKGYLACLPVEVEQKQQVEGMSI